MDIIVQKFGGSSVKDESARLKALKHVKSAVQQGNKVIVVVSAFRSHETPYANDALLNLVHAEQTNLTNRELDMLMSVGETISATVFTELALEQGLKAMTLTGHDAGIITNDEFQNAKILKVDPQPIQSAFQTADIVVVTGFQGATKDGRITTIGRGGSDVSAAILGAALNATRVDIFTDVDGIMTADPRLVTHARCLKTISYEELANMAVNGARVIHPRAVEIAKQANLTMRIRATYQQPTELGTLVTNHAASVKHYRSVTGIAHQTDLTQFSVSTDKVSSAEIFQLLATHQLSIDFINISNHQVVFNLVNGDAPLAENVFKKSEITYQVVSDCAKVAVVGAGISGTPGITARIVTTLAANHIHILQSTDSYTTIWILVKQTDLKTALNVLHDEFLGAYQQAKV
ncbi:aspartate kinase [Pediococcus inopinatus]|uniref:aspartate kinase n=1 Tax=Pediococcus inopinatus TaxID=114090 RepID=UPI002A6B2BE1|nr:aspartate kinase [Pediococcus inopinatus]WPP09656.1 aspartate kinase [Pediococcus inopinatus]